MEWIDLSSAPFLGGLILVSVKATFLLGGAFLIELFSKKTSASARHFLLSALVITASILPILSTIVPDSKLPVPIVIQSQLFPTMESNRQASASANEPGLKLSNSSLKSTKVSSLPASDRYPNFLLYLWLFGVVIAAGQVLVGMAGCFRDRRDAKPLDSKRIAALVDGCSHRLGLRKSPAVMVSHRTSVAYVSGIARPVLFLPSHVLKWPENKLSSVLLHELAHIKRKDHISWPLLNLAVSWMWFNPLLWVVMALIRQHKERACDDYAISHVDDRAGYARHLLEIYTSLKVPEKLALVSLPFVRKNQVKERILYMLNHRIDRRPINRARQLAFTVLLIIVAVPLISIKGFSSNIALHDVTPQEQEAVTAVLQGFYTDLSKGSDYQSTTDKYLTSDYFDDPVLTLEKLDKAKRRPPFDNALMLISKEGVAPAKEFKSRITAIQREGEELAVTQEINIITDRIKGDIKYDEEEGTIIRVPETDSKEGSGIEDCYLVKSLTQQIRFRRVDGDWKISKFNDGVTVMRMDTDNPYGPIFLIWMEDIDEQTTPFGPGVFKVFPRDLIPDARNTKFVLEK